jgi:hypothetical protein
MAVPFVKDATFADGSGGGTPITAAKLNNIEQGVLDAHLMPSVRVYNNAAQSIPSATETALAFNTERWDTAGGVASTQHDTVTNNSRLTCRYAGKYLVTAHAEFAVNATGQRYIVVRLNGTGTSPVLARGLGHGTYSTVLIATTTVDLAVNDYLQVIAAHDAGVALNVSASSASNWTSFEFMMTRIA